MNIAILRTKPDHAYQYNTLEYAAAFHGARVVAFVDANGAGDYRNLPLIQPGALCERPIELIVAATPLTPEHIGMMTAAGWPADRLLSFESDPAGCIRRFQAGAKWVTTRAVSLVDGQLRMQPSHTEILAPLTGPVTPALSAAQLKDIASRAFAAYVRATEDAPTSGRYAVGRNWGNFMRRSRPTFYAAAARRDVDAIDALLADCLRNEMTSGMLSKGKAYEAYNDFVSAGPRALIGFRQAFQVWRYSVSQPDIARLAWPSVGNPYGVNLGGHSVHANTFLNDVRAEAVLNLARNVPHPIVLDLGGGFGGFGHQLMQHKSHGVYVDCDLPENLLVASYFLMAANPDKRVLLYESRDQDLDPDTLAGYDIVLMPNFMLPRMADRSVDVFTNFISLSEMDHANIEEYLSQVDRVSGGYFYHENVVENGNNCEFYPVGTYPALTNFQRLSSAPSRWPVFGPATGTHCFAEFLFVNRDIDTRRYFGAGVPATGAIERAA